MVQFSLGEVKQEIIVAEGADQGCLGSCSSHSPGTHYGNFSSHWEIVEQVGMRSSRAGICVLTQILCPDVPEPCPMKSPGTVPSPPSSSRAVSISLPKNLLVTPQGPGKAINSHCGSSLKVGLKIKE